MLYFNEEGKLIWLRFNKCNKVLFFTPFTPFMCSTVIEKNCVLMLHSCPVYPIDKCDDEEAVKKAMFLYEHTKPYKAILLNHKTGFMKTWNGKIEITSTIKNNEEVNLDILLEVLRLMSEENQEIFHFCVLKMLQEGDFGTGYENLTPDGYKELIPEEYGKYCRSQLYDRLPKNNKIDDWVFEYKKNNEIKTQKFKDYAHALLDRYNELLDFNTSKD